VGCWLIPPVAFARRIESWPYERLFKEADLVVIAQATATESSQDKTTDNPWKAEFLGLNNTFQVKAVLKGKPAEGTINVLHFRLKDGLRLEDGPLFVTFRQKGIRLELKDRTVKLGVSEYLLFLKTGKDGRYEPVSGRVDPELSVREVHGALPSELNNGNAK
jgi:hypothetical protein